MKQPYNTALYMRLSRDDESYGDSVSIETQRTILQVFAKENGFHVVDEYVDDGWSGTNYDRPSFKRMIDDVEDGKINCIIVKDLSRFGREHVTMDFYLEFMFPEKHVRFIAVTDNEDTEKGLSDFVPFKNLFNEWYAKDTSRKVKAAFRAKHAKGERTFAYAPIGYKRAPDGSNAIVPDEETRWIVEKIFNLAALGYGPLRITRALRAEKVPTAGYLNYKRYGTFAHIYADAPEERRYAWKVDHISRLLTDETYIGNTIHYRKGRISYKNKKMVRFPEEEWVRVENTHEGIIDKDLFYQVQDMIKNRRREKKNKQTQIFAGLLKCADCGRTMAFGTNRRANPYSYYCCHNHRLYGNVCSAHYIRYDILYTYVLARIQYWTKRAQTSREQLIDSLLKAGDRQQAATAKKQADELKKAEKRKAELDKLFAKMYEDWSAGRITESNFDMLTRKYQAEQEEVQEKIKTLTNTLAVQKQSTENAEKWVELVRSYGKPKELDAGLLNALIEKILIHEAYKCKDGTREQEIEIIYRFVGKID